MADADSHRGEWPGVTDTNALKREVVDDSDRLADASKVGDWESVFDLIESSPWLGPNSWRINGGSWFTPLHQAAWHGAPVDVVERLIALGAWRSLRNAAGQRPVEVAAERGHRHLADCLATVDAGPARRDHDAWDRHLSDLIAQRTHHLAPIRYRPVPTELIQAEGLDSLWFAYPGMYGGFAMSVFKSRLFVESWCRVVGGSGQAHVITAGGCVLVEEGFV